ncbi:MULTISPECIES: hypothetical protein [Bacillus cereus group]|uniref:hypothetical protein n=1 Tax=Bacillus cereus group TaxID=86661 RepID=UPI000BF8DFEC|nr:hypothetical protein [Bacillus thuringiensis]MED3621898.1 hypothetical protein [Bacillus thuringiensis]PEW92126.1 hypothetical protein CN447_11575 [Bacillus thuringiensis]PFV43113.1 hypothetical protein COL14_28830 [Bacillus thuringiensis]PGS63338.1 hypothetical protein COD07_29705 [Bacillus thuringiensis]
MDLDKVIGVEEAAVLWGLSPGYIKNLCAKSEVVSKKIGKTWVIDATQNHPALCLYIKNIQGAPFVKEVCISGKSKNVAIQYVDSFDEYVTLNKNPGNDAKTYEEYFGTGDRINKILTQESARLLRQFSFLENVLINIPFKGIVYEIELNRDKLNSYLGYKIEDLSIQDRTWHQDFLEKHAYPKEGRDKLINEFVKIK